jgi:hypothetical protein
MTEAYFILAALLCSGGLWRKRDACNVVLTAGLGASLASWLAGIWPPMPVIAAIDGAVCVAMLCLWARHHSMRARLIGLVGLTKCTATIFAYAHYTANPYSYSLEYALFIDACFVAQVLIGGGYTDAIGRWLDYRLTRIAPVRWCLLRDGQL